MERTECGVGGEGPDWSVIHVCTFLLGFVGHLLSGHPPGNVFIITAFAMRRSVSICDHENVPLSM